MKKKNNPKIRHLRWRIRRKEGRKEWRKGGREGRREKRREGGRREEGREKGRRKGEGKKEGKKETCKIQNNLNENVENLHFITFIWAGYFATGCIDLLTTSLRSLCAQNYLEKKLNEKPARQTMSLFYVFLHHTGRKISNFLNSVLILLNKLMTLSRKQEEI